MDRDDRSTVNRTGPQAGREAGLSSPRRSSTANTIEGDYWRSNYQHRPYVEPGISYEEYAPAYRYGAEMYNTHAGRGQSFEQLEPELSRSWESYRKESHLSWDQARSAAKDAWVRSESQSASRLNGKLAHLEHICMDGVKGFRDAADHVDPVNADLFRHFAAEREQLAQELHAELVRRGGQPEKSGDSLGALHRGWLNLKAALGGSAKGIVAECERGEDAAVKAYQDVINDPLPVDIEVMLNRQYARIKNVHDQVRAIRDSMP